MGRAGTRHRPELGQGGGDGSGHAVPATVFVLLVFVIAIQLRAIREALKRRP